MSPNSSHYVPVFRPKLAGYSGLMPRLETISKSKTYANGGSQSREFIAILAAHFEVPEEAIVLGSSATTLLTGAARVLGGEEFYCPSWTFVASPLALMNACRRVSFVDVFEPSQVANFGAVDRSSNVLAVAPWGADHEIGPDYNEFSAIIIDAAASIANPIRYHPNFNNFERLVEVYSLHATKVLGIGEGGVAIARNPSVAKMLRSWTNFGFAGARESTLVGSNAKLSEITAAIGCLTFENIDEELSDWELARQRVWDIEERLGVTHFFSSRTHVSPYWILVFPDYVDVPGAIRHLESKGIESRKWWGQGCHKMPAFQTCRTVGELQVTENVANRSLGLPFFRDISVECLERIETELSILLKQ